MQRHLTRFLAVTLFLFAAAITAVPGQAHQPGNRGYGYGLGYQMGYGMGPGYGYYRHHRHHRPMMGYGCPMMMQYGYGMRPGMMMGPGMMRYGYGMGPGMMRYGYGMGPGGPGMMGPGMMGYGYGMGPGMGYGMMAPDQDEDDDEGGAAGPGMMGRGMMGQGQGMMGPEMMGPGMMGRQPRDISVDDVRHMLERNLAYRNNPNLKLGKVEEKDDKTIVGEIVTKDDSLVDRIEVDRRTGRIRRAQ